MTLKRKIATPRTAFGEYINNTYGKAGKLNRVTTNGYVHCI